MTTSCHKVAAHTFALGLAIDGELAEVRTERRLAHQRGAAVVLLEVDARNVAREEIVCAAGGRSWRRAAPSSALSIDLGEAAEDGDLVPRLMSVPAPLTVKRSRSKDSGEVTDTSIAVRDEIDDKWRA